MDEENASLRVINLSSNNVWKWSVKLLIICDQKYVFVLQVEVGLDGSIRGLKLADFGLAVEVWRPLHAVCGTPTYVAPEILLETGYGLKVMLVTKSKFQTSIDIFFLVLWVS